MAEAAVLLYWLPLGAGGTGFVRLNGRIYEAITAARKHRDRLALLHTALEVQVPEGWFIIEAMWPSPDNDLVSRGVTVWNGRLLVNRLAAPRLIPRERRSSRSAGETPSPP